MIAVFLASGEGSMFTSVLNKKFSFSTKGITANSLHEQNVN